MTENKFFSFMKFIKNNPIFVIINNETDYNNIIDCLNKLGTIDRKELNSLNYQSWMKAVTFYDCKMRFGNGLMIDTDMCYFNKKITVKELFKKFDIEYQEQLSDFESDENGRIIKINNYRSKKELFILNELDSITINKYEIGTWRNLINLGIVFNRQENLDNYKKYLTIHTKLKNLANRLNNGEKIDYSNRKQMRHSIYFDYKYNKICQLDMQEKFKDPIIYCLDEKFKDEAIKEIGKEDLKWYLQQNY